MLNILDTSKIRISGIVKESIVDGPGLRYVIFMQGCHQRCFMCHNQNTQPLDGGMLDDMDRLCLEWRSNPLLKGITISGGEPFVQPNQCLELINRAKETNLDVIIYTGYSYEELLSDNNAIVNEILAKADFLIDGPYEHSLRDLNLYFRGSSNQRFIDLKQTIKSGVITII